MINNKYNSCLMSTIIPNSVPRIEFLIVCEYLFQIADSEENATSQKKIISYAMEKYNIEIRRDRIPQILNHLDYLFNKYPEKFPFKLCKITSSKRSKYYISEKIFTDDEIVKIISSLESNPFVSKDSQEVITKKIINLFANKNRLGSINKKLSCHSLKSNKISNKEGDELEEIYDAYINKKRIWFKVNDSNEYTGFITSINQPKQGDLILYVDSTKKVIKSNINKFNLTKKPVDIADWIDNIDFNIIDSDGEEIPLDYYLFKSNPYITNIEYTRDTRRVIGS